MLREYRGDAHTAAWTSAGFDATEIGLASELYWGLPMGSYVRTRAWSDEQLEAAKDRMRSRGLVTADAFSDAGRKLREDVEVATDGAMRNSIDSLGEDLDPLCTTLEQWGAEIRSQAGYLGGGMHDLASMGRR
jgi:hypothetical protein